MVVQHWSSATVNVLTMFRHQKQLWHRGWCHLAFTLPHQLSGFSKKTKCVQTFVLLHIICKYWNKSCLKFWSIIHSFCNLGLIFCYFGLIYFQLCYTELWPNGISGSAVAALQAECSEEAHKQFVWQLVFPYWSLLESCIYLCCCSPRSPNCHVVTENDNFQNRAVKVLMFPFNLT